MEWADAMVWKAVFASEGAPADKGVRDYLYHLHLVQRAFLRLWRGENVEAPFPTFDDAPSLMAWARSYHAEGLPHLQGLEDQKLSEKMPQPWADFIEKQIGQPPHAISLGETALEVALHSTYHRGQVNARLRAVGGNPPSVDYIVWLWLDRPAPAWPSSESKQSSA